MFASLVLVGAFTAGCSSSSTPTVPDAGHPEDAGACPTLVPAVNKIGVSAACATCVEQKCSTQACACSKDTRCVEVEVCAEACIKTGTTADQCASNCIMDAGSTSPAGIAAYDLDECFVTACQVCGAS